MSLNIRTRGLSIKETINLIKPLNEQVLKQAAEYHNSLLKPAGSLGELEAVAIKVAGMTGRLHNTTERKVHFLFGADNGIYDEGVSGTPQYFTKIMMEMYAKGIGCGINTLCKQAGVDLRLFDLGIKDMPRHPNVNSTCRIMPNGTNNFAKERAMTPETAREVIEFAIAQTGQARAEGYQIIGTGEVGMGNTASAAACIMTVLQVDDPEKAVGRGGGLTDEAFARKKEVIANAIKFHNPDPDDPIDILSCVGSLEIAGMAGTFLGAALNRVPVVIDGVISVAGALLATKLKPVVKDYMIASHSSKEPAYILASNAMELKPLLNFGMRLGEGTGCPVAMQIVDTALYTMNNMDTFDGVSLEKEYRNTLKM